MDPRIKAKRYAEKLIQGQNLKAPFNVSSVARALGISIKLDSEKNILEYAKQKQVKFPKLLKPGNLIAYYYKPEKLLYLEKSNSGPIERQRFTIAHELGHHVMKHNNSFRVIEKNDIYDYEESRNEIEENYFAGYLLVPDSDLKERLEYLTTIFQNEALLNKLSRIFAVSLEPMRIRMKTYKDDNNE